MAGAGAASGESPTKPTSFRVITSPATMISSRSTALCSSRTLPGQLCCCSRAIASGANRLSRPVLAGQGGHEVLGQPRHVVGAIAQRRDEDRHDVEPEEQVLAEAAGPDLVLQILVGRGDDAHVDPHRGGAADRLHHLLLQRPQHLGLRLQAHVADLVEEDRPAVRVFEAAAPVGDRAGEGAAGMAEQLRLDQLLGDGGAVHLDERPAPPP